MIISKNLLYGHSFPVIARLFRSLTPLCHSNPFTSTCTVGCQYILYYQENPSETKPPIYGGKRFHFPLNYQRLLYILKGYCRSLIVQIYIRIFDRTCRAFRHTCSYFQSFLRQISLTLTRILFI